VLNDLMLIYGKYYSEKIAKDVKNQRFNSELQSIDSMIFNFCYFCENNKKIDVLMLQIGVAQLKLLLFFKKNQLDLISFFNWIFFFLQKFNKFD